jgi:ABC-2 type transport system permease protein
MKAVLRRELGRIAHRPLDLSLLLILPLLACGFTYTIFSAGSPRDLPVAVLDQDHTRLSRQLTRMIDATASVRVEHAEDSRAAEEMILAGRAYGYVLLPAGLEHDVKRGKARSVVAYTNAALLVPASLVKRDLVAATATLSAGLEIRRLRASGETQASAGARLEPIRAEVHTLFNPELSYVAALVTALFPTLLHIFILLATVQSLGSELREGTAADWLAEARGSVLRAVVGKLLPATSSFVVVASLGQAFLFGRAGVPHNGSGALLFLGTLLFILAYQGVGILLVALFANLRFATSVAAFLASPAFAYAGVTFPTMAMPPFARFWGALLPLTHYLRLLVEQTVKGAPAAVFLPSLLALVGFALVPPLIAGPRLRRILVDSRYWGRQ